MKKIVLKAISLILCIVFSANTALAASNEWREISDEELGIPSEEEEKRITEEERSKNKAISDDMYAALFAAEQGDIDTITDIKLAEKYFGNMNYSVEKYINPSYTNIHRLYYCTDILLYAGHGKYDRVNIKPSRDKRTSDNCTGVYMGTKNITDGESTLVGIGKKSMSQCRFAMFAACQTASANYNTNIAASAVNYGAQSSIGWKVDVKGNSTNKEDGIQRWEEEFFRNVEAGYSLNQSKNRADAILKDIVDKSVLTSTIYGNGNIYLSKNRNASDISNSDIGTIKIDKRLNVDCKNEELSELTDYLENNVAGFTKELFEIEMINNSWDGHNYYTILYGAQISGFETPYKVIVFVEDDEIEYSISFDKDDIEALSLVPMTTIESDCENEIKIAKEEAAEEVPHNTYIAEQTVTKKLDKNLNPIIDVSTVCIDEEDCYFVLGYTYNLN